MNENFKLALLILGVLVILSLYLVAVVDLVRRKFPKEWERVLWLAILFFLPIIGAIFYLINRKTKK